ncbi:MAG: hypothetical protein ABJF23_18260 [Bryobacteraceae bacterium]
MRELTLAAVTNWSAQVFREIDFSPKQFEWRRRIPPPGYTKIKDQTTRRQL